MERGECRISVGKPERDHFEDRLRLEYNIKMGLQEVGSGMDWIDLAEDGTGGGLL
jgi:hypothetical protein